MKNNSGPTKKKIIGFFFLLNVYPCHTDCNKIYNRKPFSILT